MMRVLKWLLVVVVLAVSVNFWPSLPASLSSFDPDRMAELQVSVWKNSRPPCRTELGRAFYRIYSQYRIHAVLLTAHSVEAVILFQSAPDAPDQEKALADDPRVFLYGQDVGNFGGAFKATKHLAQAFPGRV